MPNPSHSYAPGDQAADEATATAKRLAPLHGRPEIVHRHRSGLTCDERCRVHHPDGSDEPYLFTSEA